MWGLLDLLYAFDRTKVRERRRNESHGLQAAENAARSLDLTMIIVTLRVGIRTRIVTGRDFGA